MAFLFSKVDCEEVFGTASTVQTTDGITATVVLRCKAADLADLLNDLLQGTGDIPATGPRPYPKIFGSPPLVSAATALPAKEQYTEDGQGIAYPIYNVTVTYSTFSQNAWPTSQYQDEVELRDIKYEEGWQPSAQFLKLPNRKFRWVPKDDNETPDTLDANETPGMMYRGGTFTRTNYKMGALPEIYNFIDFVAPKPDAWFKAGLDRFPSSCNQTAYTSALMQTLHFYSEAGALLGTPEVRPIVFGKETLLAEAPSLTANFTENGVLLWDITYRFLYNEHGWNNFYRVDSKADNDEVDENIGWRSVINAKNPVGGGIKRTLVYPSVDYRNILFGPLQTYPNITGTVLDWPLA